MNAVRDDESPGNYPTPYEMMCQIDYLMRARGRRDGIAEIGSGSPINLLRDEFVPSDYSIINQPRSTVILPELNTRHFRNRCKYR